jgi:hypothetical protein
MQEAAVVLSILRERGRNWIHANPIARGINRRRARRIEMVHTGFGGRLHGKGPYGRKGDMGPRRAAHPTALSGSGVESYQAPVVYKLS